MRDKLGKQLKDRVRSLVLCHNEIIMSEDFLDGFDYSFELRNDNCFSDQQWFHKIRGLIYDSKAFEDCVYRENLMPLIYEMYVQRGNNCVKVEVVYLDFENEKYHNWIGIGITKV